MKKGSYKLTAKIKCWHIISKIKGHEFSNFALFQNKDNTKKSYKVLKHKLIFIHLL
jgi:hypothetical protein